MSARRRKIEQIPAHRKPTTYEVGYGKPPKETRFKKGQSGNPAGRPKGSKNNVDEVSKLTAMVLAVGDQRIMINEGGRRRQITMREAALRRLGGEAVAGKVRAAELYLKLQAAAAYERQQREAAWVETIMNAKRNAQKLLDYNRKNGTKEPVIPHPDQFIIDPSNGVFDVVGPLTQEEFVAAMDAYQANRTEGRCLVAASEEWIAEARRELALEANSWHAKRMRKRIERAVEATARIRKKIEYLDEQLRPIGFEETEPLWQPT